jgi:hypothetical protein
LLAASAAGRLDFGIHRTDGFRYKFARVFDGFTGFCAKKTIDGEQFLKRIQLFTSARVGSLSAI